MLGMTDRLLNHMLQRTTFCSLAAVAVIAFLQTGTRLGKCALYPIKMLSSHRCSCGNHVSILAGCCTDDAGLLYVCMTQWQDVIGLKSGAGR